MPAEPSDGFVARLREVTMELATMGAEPLRLTHVDTRLLRFSVIEDEIFVSAKQYQRMSVDQQRVYDEFFDEFRRQSATVRAAHTQTGVITDAFNKLETAWRRRHRSHDDRTVVLVVLHTYPTTELLSITSKAATVVPGPRGDRRVASRVGLLRCEEWYYRALLEEIGPRHLGEPLRGVAIEEQDAVLALWDEDESSEFHDLRNVLDAVRSLG
jgi:hypothetical protein